MRRSHLVLTAVGVAAAAATGSAFTAANTVPSSVAGYGQGQVTGATISDVDYVADGSDNTNLASVVFNSSTDVTGKTATLTLKSDATTVVGTYACTLGAYAVGTMDITCATGDTPAFDSFSYVGLTVVD